MRGRESSSLARTTRTNLICVVARRRLRTFPLRFVCANRRSSRTAESEKESALFARLLPVGDELDPEIARCDVGLVAIVSQSIGTGAIGATLERVEWGVCV